MRLLIHIHIHPLFPWSVWHISPLPSPPSVTLFSRLSLRLRLTNSRLVHREQNSFPHPTVSLLLLPSGCISVCNCLSLRASAFPQHDSQWSPQPCSLCVCSRGSVSCSAQPCPALSCPGDQSPFIPAGECCPKCGRNGGKDGIRHTCTYRFEMQPLAFFYLFTTNPIVCTVYCTVCCFY